MTTRPIAAFLDFATLGPDVDTEPLDRLVDVRYFDYSDATEMPDRLRDSRVALVNKAKLDRASVESARTLELIVVTATGTDNVDSVAAESRGIGVANIRDYCSQSVAQHVFALILSLTHSIGPYAELVRRGAWSRSPSFALFDFPIRELSGRVLGLVGYGSLGAAVARLGAAFGMEVLVSTRPGPQADTRSGRTPFPEVLARADVLSLHCPLTEATFHLIGAEELERMKRDAIIVNTARGALIDEAALADALRAGTIAGAGIDVLSREPPQAGHPLMADDVPNLIVTPHIAWAAREARLRAIEQAAENIASYLGGGRLRRIV